VVSGRRRRQRDRARAVRRRRPGGRLPATFPRAEGDVPTVGDPEKYPGDGTRVFYKEGVFVGYRWYDEKRITPAFPFGFGLSYTRFRYSALKLTPASATFSVTNVGRRTGSAVPQLYVGFPNDQSAPEPPRQLKGFKKVILAPGRSRRVTLPLDPRAFSHWDSAATDWRVTPGCFRVTVGNSSRDRRLSGRLAFGGGSCPGKRAR
jgi:beta-glucosidase